MSPNYPDQYPHNTDCVWEISVREGRTVALTFDDFNIESHTTCLYDYVGVSVAFSSPYYIFLPEILTIAQATIQALFF